MMLLSIAIPTRNRSKLLGELLASIGPQLTDDIEVVISDNASSDDTADTVARFMAQHPQRAIRYERNAIDLGAEKNLNRAVVCASGRYAWLMGDDDRLRPDALATLVPLLQGGQFASGVINYAEYDADLARELCPARLALKHDLIGVDLAAVLQAASFWFSFFSCHIVRRDLWMAADRRAFEDGPRTDSIQLYLPIVIGAQGRNFVLSKVLLDKRASRYEWADIYSADIVGGWYRALKAARERGVPRAATAVFFREYLHGLHLTRDILLKKINRYPRFWADAPMLLRQYGGWWAFWLLVAPIFITPRAMLVGARAAWRWGRMRLS